MVIRHGFKASEPKASFWSKVKPWLPTLTKSDKPWYKYDNQDDAEAAKTFMLFGFLCFFLGGHHHHDQ